MQAVKQQNLYSIERLLSPSGVERIYEGLFSEALEIVGSSGVFPIRTLTHKATVRLVDIHGFRFVTQNLKKDSVWARLGRQGKQIVWAIRLADNQYVARIVDKQVEYFR